MYYRPMMHGNSNIKFYCHLHWLKPCSIDFGKNVFKHKSSKLKTVPEQC